MSLYGALFTGVSGLKAQGSKIAIISDNIANVNTVGYKATKAAFETLVVNTGAQVSYAPGGVITNNVQLIDKQGILTATDTSTDIAISGAGFFTVNAQSDASGQPLYTRAGSFRQDDLGNFINSAGYYLLGWPLDRDGRLPGEPGNLNTISSANLDSLEVVNIETQSGVAAATTNVSVGYTLNASEPVHEGAGVDFVPNLVASPNNGVSGSTLLVPNTGTAATSGSNLAAGNVLSVATGIGLTHTYEYGGYTVGADITVAGNEAFSASTATQAFIGDLTPYTNAARSFTIYTPSTGTVTFTYTPSSPTASERQFSNLNNLAEAINAQVGLTARVVGGQIFIAPENANEQMIFANVDDVGASGLDWVGELGLTNTTASANNNRFASMSGLAALVNASDGLSAIVSNAEADAAIRIYSDNPLDTIAYYDGNVNTSTPNAAGTSLLTEFGLTTHANYNNVNGVTTLGPGGMNWVSFLNPAYDASGVNGQNMASGSIVADFSRNVRVYDSLGTGHELRLSFLKIGTNQWAVEVHVIPQSDVSSSLPNGQVATGIVTFNGDGSLRSISTGLTQALSVNWTNGSLTSSISLNMGTAGLPSGTAGATTIGLTDGLAQYDGGYQLRFQNQNGAAVGELIGVMINDQGVVIASYSNGETQALYKLPIADFANPNGLRAISGNVYAQTESSGEVNLREAGTSGTGTVVSAALESSNVELSEELTDMIVAQRAYQASAKVISTSDELLEELTRL